MRKLEEQFHSELVVVGVQAGKFPAERVTANIRQAVLRLELEHPVVNDRHFRIWRSYAVNAWPTIVLVDPEGYVLGAHPGEITAQALQPVIAKTVQDADARGLLNRAPLSLLQPERLREPRRSLAFPGKVLASPDGRLFVADSNHNRVLSVRLDPNGQAGQVDAIIGSGKRGLADAGFTEAEFYHPQGLALDGDTLYVADSENHAIRAVDLAGGQVVTLAGTGEQARALIRIGAGLATDLSSPWDVAVSDNALYIAMAGIHQLWRLDLRDGSIGPYAGSGYEDIFDDRLTTSALAQPMGLVAHDDRLYFADGESSAVRWAALPPGDRVGTLVGTGLFDYGDRDGIGDNVRLQHAQGLAYAADALYVADTYNHKIKLIDPASRECRVLLGETAGYRDGAEPQFYEPSGLSVRSGKLYVADSNNHVIRVVDLRSLETTTLQLRF